MSEDRNSTEKQNMRLILFLMVALCSSCVPVMVWFNANKPAAITDMEQSGLPIETDQGGHADRDALAELTMRKASGMPDIFCVPLPAGIRPEDVFTENRYMDRELWIYVQSSETDFYGENALYGDVSPILSGYCQEREDGILLKLEMEEVMEYRSTLEGNALTIAYCEPRELFDLLVVLDPVGGGSDLGISGYGILEKELAREVARQVQRSFSMSNVRLYLTRTEDIEISDQARVEFAEAIDADMYIRIGAQADAEDPNAYGVQGYYNEEYFIPGFGNVELADIVTRRVTIASSNRAVGITPAPEDSILRSIRVPAVELSLGYLSNAQEELLLEQEVYRQKLAEGILDAVSEACKKLEQLREE